MSPHDPDAHCSHLVAGGRRSGRTTKLLEWLKQAVPTNSYPFWDRVLLVHSLDRAQDLRGQLARWSRSRGDKHGLAYNLVYSYTEWREARIGHMPVEIAVDDVDMLVSNYFHQTPALIAYHAVDVTVLPGGH